MEQLIGVTGAYGNVGRELRRRGCKSIKCDVTDRDKTARAVGELSPNVIIHCAAITDVHQCELDYKKAFEVNVRGMLNVVDAFDGLFILLSSDHVFPDTSMFRPHGHKEMDRLAALNRYGMTKMAAEAALSSRLSMGRSMIIRTSKLFTTADLKAMNLRCVTQQNNEVSGLVKRSFLHVSDFVDGLLWVVEHQAEIRNRIIHISGTEIVSYYQFWSDFLDRNGLDTTHLKERKSKLKDADPRPLGGGLDVSLAKKLGVPLKSYKNKLKLEEKAIV